MDLEIAREILRWVIIAVGINAGTLLAITGLIAWVFVQMRRDNREISREISNVGAMTQNVAAMTREILRRTE